MVLVAWLFHLVPLSSPAEFLVLGFILGQLVLCLLIFVLAKVFLFKSAQDTRIEFNHHWAANPNRSKSIFSYFGWQPQHHSPLRNPTSISTDHSSSSHHKRHASLLESKVKKGMTDLVVGRQKRVNLITPSLPLPGSLSLYPLLTIPHSQQMHVRSTLSPA